MRKVLIANRGEIAARLILACRELGLSTVAVYSEPDADAPHAWMADEAVALAGATPAATYLDADRLIEIALAQGADAIHPGYGFLSERASFAAACRAAGLTFIGPPASAIAELGDKLAARALAVKAGVPVLPGAVITGDAASWPAPEDYPVMVKAAGGGGGMGLRRVEGPKAFAAAVAEARAQCEAAFGDRGPVELYWEAYALGGRHIEVQVAADEFGDVLALGERECSIQRRYQKVVEESPSPALDAAGREAIAELAVRLARAAGYTNVGTVEFLWTPERGPTFLEMNTRLQVEHPVTEWVTGHDLAVAQLRLAAGERVAAVFPEVNPRGHAIEARLYAEDPATGAPAPGRIDHLRWPQGPWVRVDAGVEAGMTLSPYYDPLLAKIIVWGPDRATACKRLALALERTEIAGTLVTNLPLLRAIADSPAFLAGDFDTTFLAAPPAIEAALEPELAASAAYFAQSAPANAGSVTTDAVGAVPAWARRRWR